MRMVRVGAVTASAVVVLLVTAGCGERPDPAVTAGDPAAVQQCVHDVFQVLAAMITTPYDDAPFATFVDHYGTASPAYTAYQDSFVAFYNEAVAHGVAGAEHKLLAGVTRDCSM